LVIFREGGVVGGVMPTTYWVHKFESIPSSLYSNDNLVSKEIYISNFNYIIKTEI